MQSSPESCNANQFISIEAGGTRFRLASKNTDLIATLRSLFDLADAESAEVSQDLDEPLANMDTSLASIAESGRGAVIDWIIANAFQQHRGYVWLDGSILIGNANTRLLLAGKSHSGKTTLSCALAVEQHAKIMSEDISFLDPQNGEMVPFVLPLSLRTHSVRILRETVNFNERLFFGEFIYNASHYHRQSMPSPFDIVILMDPLAEDDANKMDIKEIDAAAALKSLLPLSNVLRVENGVDCLTKAVSGARTFSLSGGTLRNRLDWIAAML